MAAVPPPALVLLPTLKILHPPQNYFKGCEMAEACWQRTFVTGALGRLDLQWPPPCCHLVLPPARGHRAAPYPPLSVGGSQQQRNEQGHRLQLQLGICPAEGG